MSLSSLHFQTFSVNTVSLKFSNLLFRANDLISPVAGKNSRDDHKFQLHLNVTDPAKGEIHPTGEQRLA